MGEILIMNRSVIQYMEEGKRWDVVKKHLKKNKSKYLLGAGVAAGLGGLEIGGHYLQKSGLKGLSNKVAKFRKDNTNIKSSDVKSKRQQLRKELRQDAIKTVLGDTIKPSSMVRNLLGTSTRDERVKGKVKSEMKKFGTPK
jgi:hypothetical protein